MHMAHVTNQGGLAVVTGAAHGLGAAAALAWASRGLDPVLIDLDPDALDATATRIREACPERQVQTRVCDVADGAALCAVADELVLAHGLSGAFGGWVWWQIETPYRERTTA